jgi:uncharacterized membrane protein SirB2
MPVEYGTVKAIHVSAAALSITLFVVRGVWMLASPERLRRRWVRIVPHVIDTVLLASALALAWQLGAGAIRGGWLVAKIVALTAYIGFGTIALKRGRTRSIRLAAFAASLATFAYIVSVARTRSPWGLFASL